MRRTTLALPVAMTVTVLAATGCSRSNSYAAGPAENYFHDLGDENYSAACQLFTDNLRRQLGDCPATLRQRLGGIPVSELRELQHVSVGHVVYKGKTDALVYTRDVKTYKTVTVRVKGSPAPRSSAVRSLAAFHATDGKTLRLTKTGNEWRISGWD
ncbi:hypothetical protein HC031_25905 [Planosporangium thailandense]|uniref:Lipoprotein n=1 Tax=Planosporangium thailandense TaxID=765197 RepID=A0ABX0Y400_9ACTN|nr:hypothetical protein [Planosporangium thailandense]NJC73126.1 hypothetical protein [Planosporangium thailandense]